jgi:hypothetical protein
MLKEISSRKRAFHLVPVILTPSSFPVSCCTSTESTLVKVEMSKKSEDLSSEKFYYAIGNFMLKHFIVRFPCRRHWRTSSMTTRLFVVYLALCLSSNLCCLIASLLSCSCAIVFYAFGALHLSPNVSAIKNPLPSPLTRVGLDSEKKFSFPVDRDASPYADEPNNNAVGVDA